MTGLDDEAPVHYFTMGAEKWQSAESWPPAEPDTVHVFRCRQYVEHGPARRSTTVSMTIRPIMIAVPVSHTRYDRLYIANVETYYDDWHGRDGKMLNLHGATVRCGYRDDRPSGC